MIRRNAMRRGFSREITIVLAIWIAAAFLSCEPANTPVQNNRGGTVENGEPTIEATPTSKSSEDWQVISADTVTLTVTASGAQSAKILYRPAFAEGRHVELKKLTSPSEPAAGKFSTQLKAPSDFAGDVWAEVSYPDGKKKESKPIALTV